MSFLQFFIWGAWLIPISGYWFDTKGWGGAEFSAVFSTLGFASILMPALTGIIADKWINAERLYGLLHILSGVVMFYIPQVSSPDLFFWVILIVMMFYMPTLSLSNSVAYTILKNNNYDVVRTFPPIRVLGTVGFIAAMWVSNLTGSNINENQFYISAICSIFLGLYSFTLPACPPNLTSKQPNLFNALGLNAFRLFKTKKFALFFLFAMFLGAALQLTNMYGETFLRGFDKMNAYQDAFIVKYPTITLSLSQISETLFILAIPFFLKKYGIKKVMIISLVAWVLRFALFAYGNPAEGVWMIIASCVVYGMAFDFFNISGSLFIEKTTDEKIRSSAQGLFMMMTNGFGAIIGSLASGYLIENYYKLPDGTNDWPNIWLLFAGYAAVITVLFAVFFKHKHEPGDFQEVHH